VSTTPTTQQTSCHTIDLTPEQGRAPEWVHLLPLGVFRGRDGRGPYRVADTAAATAVLTATQAHLAGAAMVLDYNHQAWLAARTGGPAPAAGWVRELAVRDDGLWGRIDWLPEADQAIAKKEYRYLSPVFDHTPQGDVIRLRCAALTNLPNLELTALASQQASPLEVPAMPADPVPPPAPPAPPAVTGGNADPLAAVRTAFGLPADADGAAIAAHAQSVAQLLAQKQTPPPVTPDPAQYVPMAAFTALQNQVAGVLAQTAAHAAQTAITEATAAGKLPPALTGWAADYAAKDLAGFQAWVAAAPVLVAAHAQSAGAGGSSAAPPAGAPVLTPVLTAEQTAVCAQLGLSAEAFSQHIQQETGK